MKRLRNLAFVLSVGVALFATSANVLADYVYIWTGSGFVWTNATWWDDYGWLACIQDPWGTPPTLSCYFTNSAETESCGTEETACSALCDSPAFSVYDFSCDTSGDDTVGVCTCETHPGSYSACTPTITQPCAVDHDCCGTNMVCDLTKSVCVGNPGCAMQGGACDPSDSNACCDSVNNYCDSCIRQCVSIDVPACASANNSCACLPCCDTVNDYCSDTEMCTAYP